MTGKTDHIDSPFIYETNAGKTIRLKKQSDILTVGFVRKNKDILRRADDDSMWLLLEAGADKKNLALVDELTMAEFATLSEAWAKTADRPAGE